jgi:outer membrane translocation and assembly module TamA
MRFGVLALLGSASVPQFSSAQSPSCLDRQSPHSAAVQSTKVSITDIEFSGENPLSSDVIAKLLRRIKQLKLSVGQGEDDSNWLAEIEAPVLDALQKEGYFQALLTSTPYLIQSEASVRHYVIRVEIESGRQFRLGEIKFSGMTVFSVAELRTQFSLRHGDLFDVPELRKGMDSVARLYSSKGFIDMTPEPEFQIDDKGLLISVLVKTDEGKQYRVGNVEVHGLDHQMEEALKSRLGAGQVVDGISMRNFFQERQAGLPNIPLEEAIHLRRNFADATVDFVVDFRTCPTTQRDL